MFFWTGYIKGPPGINFVFAFLSLSLSLFLSTSNNFNKHFHLYILINIFFKICLETPYEGGVFELRFDIPRTYPHHPPKVKFVTRVNYHLSLLSYV